MLIKANNINFFIDVFNKTIKRSEFTDGAMLFSDIDSGRVPYSEDCGIFYPGSDQLKIFTDELKFYLSNYELALKKFRKLKAFM